MDGDGLNAADLSLRPWTRGPITVNGQPFDNVMPPLANFTDHEIADVLTFARNRFGNAGDAVADAEVAKLRAALAAPRAQGHP